MVCKKFAKYIITTLLLSLYLTVYPQSSSITVDVNKKGAQISPLQYGLFYEEIQHAGDGGLYPEMIENRSFEEFRNGVQFETQLDQGIMPAMDDPKNIKGWKLTGSGKMSLDQSEPLNRNNPTSLKVESEGAVSITSAGFLPPSQ